MGSISSGFIGVATDWRGARPLGNAYLVYRYARDVLPLLETFCAVAEYGSLTRAAEHLNLSQPAVTRQLKSLERQIGAVLVTRTPQGVTLTAAGQAILPHARQALSAVRALQQAAVGVSETGRLRIAAGLMATLYVLPPVVARFRERYPQVTVELQPADQRIAVERLLEYEVDAAVIASPVKSPQVRGVPILHDPLLLITGPAAAAGPTSLSELRDCTLLVLPSTTGLHQQIVAALRELHVVAHLVEHPTAETIKSAVALGMGCSILPVSAVRDELAVGRLSGRPLTDWPGAERIIHALVRAEGRPPKAVADFVGLLRRHYRG
jgi:DNA-binding transcriptional LysR family regulator